MNREIIELREVVMKLVPLLTGKGLVVTQRGSQAYVAVNRLTQKPERVNIPNISDNATPEFMRAIQGFIDHEVAHVLLTNWDDYIVKGDPMDAKIKRLQVLINIVEDTMIEREIVKIFPGARKNIADLRRHFIDRITVPACKQARNEKELVQVILVPLMRALAGHDEFQEFMDQNKYWDLPLVKVIVDGLSAETKALLPKMTKTSQTRAAAEELEAVLHPPQPESSGAEGESDDDAEDADGESQDKPDKPAGEGDGNGDRDHSDSEDDGEPSAAKGDSSGDAGDDEGDEDDSDSAAGSGDAKDKKDKKNDDEKEDAAAEEESDGDEPDEDPDEDSGEPDAGDDSKDDDGEDAEDEAAAGDEKGDGDETDGDDAEGGDDDEGGAENDGDGEDADDDEADEEADDSGQSNTKIGDTSSVDDGEHAPGDPGVGSDDTGHGGGSVGTGGAGRSMLDFEDDAFESSDLSSQVSIQISKDAVSSLSASDYTVFTRELDRIETLQISGHIPDTWVPKMEDTTRQMVGRMQKDIERMLAAQSYVIRTPGHRTGRLHAPSLHRLTTGDDRVFTRRQEHTSKDTAVMLLIDNSGSMMGDKIQTAMVGGYALASTLEKVQIANEVIGFTTGDYYSLPASMSQAIMEEYNKTGMTFSRTIPLHLPIYKSFDERISAEVKKRIAFTANSQRGLQGNVDGESLEYAAVRLLKRREKRKVMIVMSDGHPTNATNADGHLKMTVEKLTKIGIEMIGIGIQDRAVSRFYPKHVVLNDVSDLPGQIMQELKAILS